MISSLVVTLHVLSVFWLVGGTIGRSVALGMARRAPDLPTLQACHAIGSRLERIAVRPGSALVLLTGGAAAGVRGWPLLGALQGAAPQWVLVSLIVYLTIIPIIVFVFLPRARVFHGALEEAKSQSTITPALRAALADPVVGAARVYEMVMIVALAFLMVAKPF
jgi:hypothetical protein